MDKRTFLRLVALAGCSVLIGAFGYIPGASAHIGASHAPFTTTRPDLLSAAITTSGQVRACFDETITDAGAADEFEAKAYDSSINSDGDDYTVDPTDSKCALIDFPHPALSQATILSAEFGAVQDTGGANNTDGAVTLQGSVFNVPPRAGNSDAPELLTTTPLPGPNRVAYDFDEPVDADMCDSAAEAADFGFHEGNGDRHYGDGCFDVSGSTVTIDFTLPGDDVDQAVRYFARTFGQNCDTGAGDGAIYDRGTSANAGVNADAKWNTVAGIGAPTADPDLTTVTKIGNNTLGFTFDELVQSINEECFVAVGEDGDTWEGDSFTQPSGTQVNVVFDDVERAFDQIVRAGVYPDAALDSTNTDGNTYGSFNLQTNTAARSAEAQPTSPPRMGPGYSDGPDLEQAVTDKTNDTIDYCTDELLHQIAGDYSAGDFFVLDNAGNDTSGSNVVSVSDECVKVAFSGGDVDLAVAAGIYGDTDGMWDRLDNADEDNPDNDDPGNEAMDSVAVKVDAAPPTGTPPAPTPTPPTPPGQQPAVRTGLCDSTRSTAPLSELLIGGGGPDLICGFGGDDTLRGLGGADTLKGQDGGDVHAGGKGNDSARGGAGRDILRGSGGNDTLKGGAARDTARGGKGDDLCRTEVERGCEA